MSSLSLKSNEIGQPSGVESVGELLDRDTNLACLDLRCNNLTDQSVMLIAPSLVNPTTHLVKLVLYANKITHAGAIAIFVVRFPDTTYTCSCLLPHPLPPAVWRTAPLQRPTLMCSPKFPAYTTDTRV
jgi:hypothetical protein